VVEHLRVFPHVGFFCSCWPLSSPVAGGLVKVIVNGDVSSVRVAVEAGTRVAGQVGELVGSHVIANPAEGVIKAFVGLTHSFTGNRGNRSMKKLDPTMAQQVAEAIDDKLVEFTRTYFEMDPLMNIRFPRAFAAGKKGYQGRTYHFHKKKSLEAFENSPLQYVEAR
jgi:YHS domain-containing protein